MRARVLFVAEAVTLAHVARANVLARCLDPNEFEVHGAWDPRYNHLLGDLSLTYHPIRTMPGDLFLARLARGLPMHDTPTLRDYVGEELPLIARVRPDIIVSDFRFSLLASARLAGIPLVTVANAYWSPYGRQTFVFPEYDYPLAGLVGKRLAQSLFKVFRGAGFAAHTRPLNRVFREHRLKGIGGDIRTMYTLGDYTAYADIPQLIPTYDAPANHRYIGAVVWSPAVPPPAWWNELPTDRPIVYVTPGSSGDERVTSVALDALANLPVTVIAATAGRTALSKPPANARVADFLPGAEAAARASLVICNGGSPTTYQALAAGVPVLGVVSNNMDQHLNMEAVCRAGAGKAIGARTATSSSVRALAEELLNGWEHRSAAKQLAGAHRAHNFHRDFPRLLRTVLSAQPSQQAGSLTTPDLSSQEG